MSPLKRGGPELTGTSGTPCSLARSPMIPPSSAVLGRRTHCGLILWAKLRSTEYCSSTSGSQLISRAPSTPDSVDRGTILTSWKSGAVIGASAPPPPAEPAEPPRSHLAALGLAAGSARSYWGSVPPPQALPAEPAITGANVAPPEAKPPEPPPRDSLRSPGTTFLFRLQVSPSSLACARLFLAVSHSYNSHEQTSTKKWSAKMGSPLPTDVTIFIRNQLILTLSAGCTI